jgi:ABC-type polysaccharide/polyol phosphate transport system ATPase subunit
VPAVALRGVSKRFYFYEHRTSSLREWFIRRVLRRPLHVRRAAFTLHNVDLTVDRGEAIALLGRNGSGKSTILRLIAGIYEA